MYKTALLAMILSIKTYENLRLSGDLSPVHGSHLGRLEGQDHGKQRNRHHQPWTVSLSILKHQQQSLQKKTKSPTTLQSVCLLVELF